VEIKIEHPRAGCGGAREEVRGEREGVREM